MQRSRNHKDYKKERGRKKNKKKLIKKKKRVKKQRDSLHMSPQALDQTKREPVKRASN